jgi:tetratricopeptide (TPR) repeat protein
MQIRLFPALAVAMFAGVAAMATVAGPAGAAKAPASPVPSASPEPSASPTATPEPLDKAIPRLEGVLKTDPTNKGAATELAADYLQVSRPDLALALTQRLLQNGNKTAQIYYLDGLAQNGVGHQRESLADLEQAANLEPTNPGVLGSLTNMYLQQNRPADAERVSKRALTFNPKDKTAYLAYGSVLATEGKFDAAIEQFAGAEKLDPKDIRPILLEAQVYINQNAIALAESEFDRALTVDPTSVEALVGKARLTAAQHDVKGAIATYEKIFALQIDPTDKVAVIDQEAVVYANEKMDTDAVAAYQRAITAYPNVFSAHTSYGEYLMAKGDKAGAEREFIAGSGPNHDQVDAIARLGQLYATENQLSKAIDQFKLVTGLVPNDPRAHLLLGATYAANKQFDHARDEFKASYNLAHSPDALMGLGQADLQTRNYVECTQVFDALDHGAPDLSRRTPAILYSLGQCYQMSRQLDKAKSAYEKLLGFVPANSQAATQLKTLIATIDKEEKSAKKPAPKKA